jgi:hypothetical protein
VEVVRLALSSASAPVPSVVVPFLNVTAPLGVPIVDATVAVNFTAECKIDGSCDDVRDVCVCPLIVKTADLVPPTLPALSVLWNVTVLLASFETMNGDIRLWRSAVDLIPDIQNARAGLGVAGTKTHLHRTNVKRADSGATEIGRCKRSNGVIPDRTIGVIAGWHASIVPRSYVDRVETLSYTTQTGEAGQIEAA